MRKIHVVICICIFHFGSAFGQILYFDSCKVSCNKCKPEDPMKVEYKPDSSKNIVMRIINDKDAIVLENCNVLDKDNWVCNGINKYSNLGRQYSTKGIAYWISSMPPDKGIYHCEFDKGFFGGFVSREK